MSGQTCHKAMTSFLITFHVKFYFHFSSILCHGCCWVVVAVVVFAVVVYAYILSLFSKNQSCYGLLTVKMQYLKQLLASPFHPLGLSKYYHGAAPTLGDVIDPKKSSKNYRYSPKYRPWINQLQRYHQIDHKINLF